MQELRDLASIAYGSPVWTFLYCLISAVLITVVVGHSFDFMGRLLTTFNILVRGWPPEHVDGSGECVETFYEEPHQDNEQQTEGNTDAERK